MKRYIGVVAIVVFAIAAVVAAQSAFAADQKKVEDPVADLKSELNAFQKEVAALVDAVRYGAAASQDAIQRFRDKIDALRKRVADLKPKIPGFASRAAPLAKGFNKSLQRGNAGDDVLHLQGLLKKFPDLYPEGLETGIFGPATEHAIKKMQEKLGLEQVGNVGPETRKKLDELEKSIHRKQPPKILSIAPDEISVNTLVTLTGSGFTLENNSLFVRGKTILSGLTSHDGTEIVFAIPADIPCEVGSACPLKIVNSNGISNAKAIKFVELVAPPAPEPLPEPTPPPPTTEVKDTTPPVRSEGGPSGTLPAGTTSVTISMTTDEKATCKYSEDGSGVSYAQMLNTFSDTNSTFHSSSIALEPGGGNTLYAVGYGFHVRCQDSAGNVNTDDTEDSLIWFSVGIKPILPILTMVSPNGGEAYKYGDAVTITWEAKNIASKLVNIKMFKAGNIVQNIASNVAQSVESGFFIYNWIVQNGFTPASDYTIEVSDAANPLVRDTSDGQFRISNLAALQVYGPNGGETAMRGFSALLFWTYSGYTPVSINVNLYKGGVFYRTLASGVKPIGFSGYTFLPASYPTNSRYVEVPIALDIPEGDDYTMEIVDGTDSSIRDKSDAAFRIITIPSPVTFKGRLLDRFTLAPLANVFLGGYGTYTYSDGRTTNIAHPRVYTNANGEFSFATTTDHMISEVVAQALIGVWPGCYGNGMAALYRYPQYPMTSVNIGYDFTLQYPNSSSHYKYVPLLTSEQNWGDQLMWPMTQIKVYTDVPVQLGLEYQNNYGLSGGGGNSRYKLEHTLSTTIPLDIDTRVKLTDQAGTISTSSFIRLARDYGCAPKAISFMDGTFQWEPYLVGIGYSYTGGTVGLPYKGTLIAGTVAPNGGVAPFTWKLLPGTLPPGLSFDAATGILSGTPTTAGTYYMNVRVTDANGVRASSAVYVYIR